MSRNLTTDEATAILGEGFHASLRKAGDSSQSIAAVRAIDQMDDDEWHGVLVFLVEGLGVSGIHLT